MPTFSGLKQAVIHPQERIFVGELPYKISNIQKNPEKYISTISVKKNGNATNKENWFDFDVDLNIGLTTVIGNKGSGKSAFADLLGFIGKSENADKFSFLSKTRFAKEDKQYNCDYMGSILWADDEKTSVDSFGLNTTDDGISLVRYLPQRYIEETCNNLDRGFQEEIDKVIFSYVDDENKGEALSLNDLVFHNQISIKDRIDFIKMSISSLNEQIIRLERKRKENYASKIENGKLYYENELIRHDANKPNEVILPHNDDKLNTEVLEFIGKMNIKIRQIEEQITLTQQSLSFERSCLIELIDFKNKLKDEQIRVSELNILGEEISVKFKLNPQIKISYELDLNGLDSRIEDANNRIENCSRLLSQDFMIHEYMINTDMSIIENDFIQSISLFEKKQIIDARINRAKEKLNQPQKLYQKYIDDLKNWEIKRKEIIGDDSNINSLSFYRKEEDYLKTYLSSELGTLRLSRQYQIEQLYNQILKKKEVLNDIYQPIEKKLDSILETIKSKVVFKVSTYTDSNFVKDTLLYINQSVQSNFRGKTEGAEYINSLIRKYDFSSIEGAFGFVDSILDAATSDEDRIDSLVRKRLEFYNHITCMDYLNVGFSLEMEDKELEQLSPGEKGIVLLVFYLALDKEEKPLIIDQPEDNLDNQSVFDKLVPCVLEAKKNRQVILITHNPNLAIACDSELIIYSENSGNEIKYHTGPIEDRAIRKKIVDILEGTMPAFDLRTNKYKDIHFAK